MNGGGVMASIHPLSLAQLRRTCDLEQFDFETTADLPDLKEIVGQDRAVAAVRFGIGIDRAGYNIFALGPAGVGKQALIKQFLETRATKGIQPSGWCYVYNFDEPHRPRALALPAGTGVRLRQDMRQLVDDLTTAIPTAFEAEEYRMRRDRIQGAFQEREHEAFDELRKRARERGLSVMRSPNGLMFAPLGENGEVMPQEAFQKISEAERLSLEKEVEELHNVSQDLFQKMPQWEKEMRQELRELGREITRFAVGYLIDALRKDYEAIPDVIAYLEAVRNDVVENVVELIRPDGQEKQAARNAQNTPPISRRYQVNVLIDHNGLDGAPVIFEDNPTYANLVGRVEHLAEMGMLQTDFNLIKPGALHRANGGYLVLNAEKLLSQPYAWEGLKRALRSEKIRIESLGQMHAMISTVSLEPEPIPLDVKVVLLGDRRLYYMLQSYDREFGELFKVAADFDDDMVRDEKSLQQYAQLIATVARRESVRPLDRGAVARVIEESSRSVEDSEKLSVQIRGIVDLLQEADYWANRSGHEVITADDIHNAIVERVYRAERVQRAMEAQILRETILVDTDGEAVGQINGLSVLSMGDHAFGKPSRITAQVSLGRGEVIDIEREVDLSGPSHSKGVLILSGFLGGRYGSEYPLSLSASLAFEQSYGGIDGDSASSTELYVLLSAISGVPIKQSFAVTGSVNQHGQVQAIGGVNHKIEGFFDICKARGLTGHQGVLIPAANVKHLMLRQDVIDAVADDKFQIYPIETIDQGIEILTGMAAGEKDEKGNYPEETINGRVSARLRALAQKRAQFNAPLSDGKVNS
ncbi:MAG: lon-related putative ATP-dependent protease [Candidatus Latescibacterota bacterium]|jgi:lon-related putative ATP-dependent protease